MTTEHDPDNELVERKVNAWFCRLDSNPQRIAHLSELLSDEEHSRAARYTYPGGRDRWIVTRGQLKLILSSYCGRDPRDLSFSYGLHGKPFLRDELGCWLRFNLSHSKNQVIYAVTRGHDVGVDIEKQRFDLEYEALASRYFSQREQDAFFSLSSELRNEAFFRCWTRKEAVLKALGDGLTLPLHEFDVTLEPDRPARLLEARWQKAGVGDLTIQSLDIELGWACAVALLAQGSWTYSMMRHPDGAIDSLVDRWTRN